MVGYLEGFEWEKRHYHLPVKVNLILAKNGLVKDHFPVGFGVQSRGTAR